MSLPLPKISDMYFLIYCFIFIKLLSIIQIKENQTIINVQYFAHVMRIFAYDFIISYAHSAHINKFENHILPTNLREL